MSKTSKNKTKLAVYLAAYKAGWIDMFQYLELCRTIPEDGQ